MAMYISETINVNHAKLKRCQSSVKWSDQYKTGPLEVNLTSSPTNPSDKIRRKIDDRIELVLIEKGHDDSGFLSEVMKPGVII
jgi:hypothetical protein